MVVRSWLGRSATCGASRLLCDRPCGLGNATSLGVSNARFILAAAVAIADVLASRVERLPRDTRRIINPGFFRFSVAASRLALFDDGASGLFQTSVNLMQFRLAFDLDAKVIETRLATTCRDCEVHARIVEHPLRVIAFHNRWFRGEQGGIEPDGLCQIAHGDVQVQPFHDAVTLARLARVCLHTARAHASAAPWQQFSVRKPSRSFMTSKRAA